MQTASKKVINGWAMYDWSNSVYNLVITSTIFPAYYEAVNGNGNENTLIDKIKIGDYAFPNTALYNYILAIAFIIMWLKCQTFVPSPIIAPSSTTAVVCICVCIIVQF